MDIERLADLKPGESFNTAGILSHLLNLMNPKNEKLDQLLRTRLVSLGNSLAQFGKDLQNPLPALAEKLKAHIGVPSKGSRGVDVLAQLNAFENNHLPNLVIQQEELHKTREQLAAQYQLLVAKGTSLELARLDSLQAEVEKIKTGKLQSFVEQKEKATEILMPLKASIEQITGKGKVQLEQEETAATATAAPTPDTTTAATPARPEATPPTTPTPE